MSLVFVMSSYNRWHKTNHKNVFTVSWYFKIKPKLWSCYIKLFKVKLSMGFFYLVFKKSTFQKNEFHISIPVIEMIFWILLPLQLSGCPCSCNFPLPISTEMMNQICNPCIHWQVKIFNQYLTKCKIPPVVWLVFCYVWVPLMLF